MASIRLWGFRFLIVLEGSAMEDACWTLPRSCASGVPTPRGKGAGPTAAVLSRLPLLRPVAPYTLDMGTDFQGHQVRAQLRGLAAPP